jgi:hypothetical protein
MDNDKRTNMCDNIDAMDSLMTIFDCELYELEHLLLCLGDCYYLDVETYKITKAFCNLIADEQGNVQCTVYPMDENTLNPADKVIIEPASAYVCLSKDIEELEALIGQ